MTGFWLAAAALAAIATLAVALPLAGRRQGAGISRRDANLAIYRDQLRELDADLAAGTLAPDDYSRSKMELESRLLRDVAVENPASFSGGKRAAIIAGIAILLCAPPIYLAVGAPAFFESSPQHIEAMVVRLAAHLRENPDDTDGWQLLGRSYAALGRFPEAVDAYARAAVRAPRDAQLLADFADALGMARGQSLRGAPENLLLRALEIDPENMKALALAGTAAFDRRDFRSAAAYWSRMQPLVPAGTEDQRVIQENVAAAHKLAAGARNLNGKGAISTKTKVQARAEDAPVLFSRTQKGPPKQ